MEVSAFVPITPCLSDRPFSLRWHRLPWPPWLSACGDELPIARRGKVACSIAVPARQALWVSLEQDLRMCIGMCGSLGLPPSTSGQELSFATPPP